MNAHILWMDRCFSQLNLIQEHGFESPRVRPDAAELNPTSVHTPPRKIFNARRRSISHSMVKPRIILIGNVF